MASLDQDTLGVIDMAIAAALASGNTTRALVLQAKRAEYLARFADLEPDTDVDTDECGEM